MSKVILRGFPRLKYGNQTDATFIASLNLALRYLGEDICYRDLMGFSGWAFRLMYHHPEPCMTTSNEFGKHDVVEFLGYTLKFVNGFGLDPETWRKEGQPMIVEMIQDELNAGKPVLARVGTWIWWGIITGYENGKLLARTFDGNEEYTPVNVPLEICILRKQNPPIDRGQAAKNALSKAYDSFFTRRSPVNHVVPNFNCMDCDHISDGYFSNGLAAYEDWVDDLQDLELFSQLPRVGISKILPMADWYNKIFTNLQQGDLGCGCKLFEQYWENYYIYFWNLVDARRAAGGFLSDICKLVDKRWEDLLLEVSDKFKEILTQLLSAQHLFPAPYSEDINDLKSEPMDWTQGMRVEAAQILTTVKEMEVEAYTMLSHFVHHEETEDEQIVKSHR